MQAFSKNVVAMRDLCGPCISTNGLVLASGDQRYFCYGIFNVDRQQHYHVNNAVAICGEMGWPHVTVLGQSKMWDLTRSMEEFQEKAEGVGFRGQNGKGACAKDAQNDIAVRVISNSWLLLVGTVERLWVRVGRRRSCAGNPEGLV